MGALILSPIIFPAVPAPYAPGRAVPHGSPAELAELSDLPVVPAVKWLAIASSQTALAIPEVGIDAAFIPVVTSKVFNAVNP